MNQQVNELRNVFLGFSQQINSLEKKVEIAINQSQRAKEYSELARDVSLRQLHGDLQKNEINIIRTLFSGATPSLDEIINSPTDDNLSDSIINIFEDTDFCKQNELTEESKLTGIMDNTHNENIEVNVKVKVQEKEKERKRKTEIMETRE